MPSFDYQPTPVPLNPLLDYADIQNKVSSIGINQNEAARGSQDLTDRATLRGLAGGLSSRDPNAYGTAASLGPSGQSAVSTLSTSDAQTAASKLAALQFTTALPQWGGSPPASTNAPAPAQTNGAASASAQGGSIEDRLGSGESTDRPGVVNKQGYSGQFQFGTGRLTDLGMYQPAQGENPNGNKWQGTFDIPGFPDVKTYGDFLRSPDAQRAAMQVHTGDIRAQIAATPGADKLNQDGLIAVAHLGGVDGMQKFVASGGRYNPADANGTTLAKYYGRYSQGGVAQLAQDHGHPDGPLPNYQVASNAGAAGTPQTANDASGPTVSSTPESLQSAIDTMRMRQANPGSVAPDASSPQQSAPVEPQNRPVMPGSDIQTTLPGADERFSAQPSQDNVAAAPMPPQAQQLAPVAPPMAASTAPQPAAGEDRLVRDGMGRVVTGGAPPGMGYDKYTKQLIRIPDSTKMEIKDSGPIRSIIDPYSGQTVRTEAIPDHSRLSWKDTPQGQQAYQSGKPVGPVVPYSGRPEQDSAYKADVGRTGDITQAAQTAQSNMPRLNEMADLAQGLATGPTAELRGKAARYLEAAGVSPEKIKAFTGMSGGSQVDMFMKLNVQAAGADAKGNMGSNNGIQSMQLYQTANPGMNLLPDANKRITNMMRVQNQATLDYAQSAMGHFGQAETAFLGGGNYTPLTAFNRTWQAQNNPQIYAAATGILNGDSFNDWSKRISPDEARRAAGIAARVDPTTMMPMRKGAPVLARSFAGAP